MNKLTLAGYVVLVCDLELNIMKKAQQSVEISYLRHRAPASCMHGIIETFCTGEE